MKFTFLSANEQLSSGLLQSQMIRPALAILGSAITIVNIHRPFANRFSYDDLQVLNLPILVPFRFINFRSLFFLNDFICLFYALAIAVRLPRQARGSIFVSRGYVPGLVAWWLNRLTGTAYFFDPRSLYVHEHVGSGNVRESSLVQRYWLWVERRLVNCAEATVCVSQAMATYYNTLGLKTPVKTILIPCFAEVKPIPDAQSRAKARNTLRFTDDDIVIAYYGSLNSGWNNLDIYSEFFRTAGEAGAKILIISQDAAVLQQSALANLPYVRIVGGPTLPAQEATLLLGAADYGVVLMGEVPDWKTRLSVKFAEYTCAGLPVIVGQYVGEAVRLVQTFDLAPSFVTNGTAHSMQFKKASVDDKKRIQRWATEYFSQNNLRKILDFRL
jgi:hypothetical protein